MLSQAEIQSVKKQIRDRYSAPIRDFLHFSYQGYFNDEDPTLNVLVTAHNRFFTNALSKNENEISLEFEQLIRIAQRHGLVQQTVQDINVGIIYELFKIVASQNRNSSHETISAFNIVISMIGFVIWTIALESSATTLNTLVSSLNKMDNRDPAMATITTFRNNS
jgi:hypothetical protein